MLWVNRIPKVCDVDPFLRLHPLVHLCCLMAASPSVTRMGHIVPMLGTL